MPTVLLVATSSTPLATENELAWWLAERTTLQHFAVGALHGAKRRRRREPAELDLLEAHGLHQRSVVRGEVGFHLDADLLGHVVQQRLPQRRHGRLVLGRKDREGQLLGRAGGR